MNESPFRSPFVSAHSRARLTKTLLLSGAILSFASMLLSALALLFPEVSADEEATENVGGLVVALLLLGLGSLEVLICVATVVCFLMWLYRSYENLPAFGTPRRSIAYSSGWAVGSFFIPFANLVVPYRAVKEVWRKSEPSTAAFLLKRQSACLVRFLVVVLAVVQRRRQHLFPGGSSCRCVKGSLDRHEFSFGCTQHNCGPLCDRGRWGNRPATGSSE